MVRRLYGTKPYQNEWWHIVSWTVRNKNGWSLHQSTIIFIQENSFENYVCKTADILLWPQLERKQCTHIRTRIPTHTHTSFCVCCFCIVIWSLCVDIIRSRLLVFLLCGNCLSVCQGCLIMSCTTVLQVEQTVVLSWLWNFMRPISALLACHADKLLVWRFHHTGDY